MVSNLKAGIASGNLDLGKPAAVNSALQQQQQQQQQPQPWGFQSNPQQQQQEAPQVWRPSLGEDDNINGETLGE
jgi:hypothetical protein